MLWVYGQNKYFTLSVRGSNLDVYGRQILRLKAVHPWKVNSSFRSQWCFNVGAASMTLDQR